MGDWGLFLMVSGVCGEIYRIEDLLASSKDFQVVSLEKKVGVSLERGTGVVSSKRETGVVSIG